MEWLSQDRRYDIKHWWSSLCIGIVFIIAALWMTFTPVYSYVTLTLLFSIAILLSGALEIVFAIGNRKVLSSWGWYLAAGIIDIPVGLYLIAYPVATMEVIPYIIGFWLLFRGFTLCGYSTDLSVYKVRGWGWYLAFGIVSLLCSLVLLCVPFQEEGYETYMLALSLFIIGSFRIVFSFELKKLGR